MGNDQSFNVNVGEVLSSLAKHQGLAVDEWISRFAHRGVEAQLTYRWRCSDRASLGQDGCDVTTELGMLSDTSSFQVPGRVHPVSSTRRGPVQRRSVLTGVMVYL